MDETPRRQPISVRFRVPAQVRGGALYNVGDVATLEPEDADTVLRLGLADLIMAEGTLAPATRAYPEPPAHKMVTAAPNKQRKEDRRGR